MGKIISPLEIAEYIGIFLIVVSGLDNMYKIISSPKEKQKK
ncbi:unnamed protein product [Phyllotreta striolata]|uniref:Uncharacterized protein n=1 Tax=Phyllotreta striolata TaxID=444603 RepID=A0A9N9XU72_PHYSR|nr:unnamed protein product [Phyllotreta striolata]